MEPDELTLSDVHVNVEFTKQSGRFSKDYTGAVSRFPFRLKTDFDAPVPVDKAIVYNTAVSPDITAVSPDNTTVSHNNALVSPDNAPVAQDDDGDAVVCRRYDSKCTDVIYIEHTLSTRLIDVGLQVWQGSLLLCDYILDNPAVFSGRVVVELGAGVGLAGITAAIFAGHVFCTDIGDEILSLCARNAETNQRLFSNNQSESLNPTDQVQELDVTCQSQNVISVRELDWMKDKLPTADDTSKYHWSPDDVKKLEETDVIIAADVIYDDNLTDAFFRTLHRFLCKQPAKSVFIALERRLNFTLEDLDVSCPAYTHFRRCLGDLSDLSDATVTFTTQQIDTDHMPQYFDYKRTKYLEIWKICSSFENG